MEIKHLETFKAILVEGSYTNAAKKLAYTQSTVTSHMQALGQELGEEPFIYQQKRLKLSPSGELLLPLCNQLLATHQEMLAIKKAPLSQGKLRIAAPESLTIYYLAELLSLFQLRYPGIEIELSNASCGINQRQLMEGEADVALMIWPEITDERYRAQQLMVVEPALVTAASSVAETLIELQGNTLTNQFIINEKACSYRVSFERELVRRKTQFPTTELWSIQAIKQLVQKGIGFTYLPKFTVAAELASGSLRQLDFQVSESLFAHLVTRQTKHQSPLIETFCQFILTEWPK